MPALLSVDLLGDLDDQVEMNGLVHQLQPVVGAVGKQMFGLWPKLSGCVQDHPGAGAVREVGWRET